MSAHDDRPFFVGYLGVPPGLRLFLLVAATMLIGAFAALGFAIGATQSDPGDGAFRYDWGRQVLRGSLQTRPYPVLYLTEDSKRLPAGTAVLLSGVGKRGVQRQAQSLDGRLVEAAGVLLKRGDLDMLQVGNEPRDFAVLDQHTEPGRTEPIHAEPLGRWRLSGEICDGKCYAGAMRPGRGISHRACANLCIAGGVPPVFVSTAPVEGRSFFLMADHRGEPVNEPVLRYSAKLVVLDAEIERRGGLLVLKIHPDSLHPLP